MVEIDEIPERYRLSFLVGEIVRNDSYAEHETRVLWTRLEAAGLATEERQRDLSRLLKQVRRMLRDERVPAIFASICVGAIDELAEAHRRRALLVHDVLVAVPWRSGEVRSATRRTPARPMQDLADCAASLQRGIYRMRGLWIIAPHWIGGELEAELPVRELVSWTRVAMGQIAETPGVIEGTPGEAAVPPGGWRVAINDEG